MEELFRFSVVRAATRSRSAAISLERPPMPQSAPPAPTTPSVAGTPTTTRASARSGVSPSLPAFIASRSNIGGGGGRGGSELPVKSFQESLRDEVLNHPEFSAPNLWTQFEQLALDFASIHAPNILNNPLWVSLQELVADVRQSLADPVAASKIVTTLPNLLDKARESGRSTLPGYQFDLADLFLALLIVRRGGPVNLDRMIRSKNLWEAADFLSDNPTLQEIADRIRVINLINGGSAGIAPPSGAKTPAERQAAVLTALQQVMNQTLLLPSGVFAPLQKPVHGVGFRELHVVKQHIRRYEMAEIGRIENILKGESRDHNQKHTLSNERDTFVQTDTTTETDKELTSTDHVDIKNETDNQVKEDTKVDAGVHAQYDGGSYKLQADLTVSYDKSSDETKKFSSDVAKDVTQKAVSKVTQMVTQSQTTKIIETFEETEDQSFDNKNGSGHISGIYQWVEKVYLAQVFNLGRHMLFDIMVPEPGASLLSAATIAPTDQDLPTQPDPPGTFHIDASTGKKVLDTPLTPSQITDETVANYWIAKYQATGVDPIPSGSVVAAKQVVFTYKDDDIKQGGDVIQIEEGFEATSAVISAAWFANDNPDGNVTFVDVTIGNTSTRLQWPTNQGRNASRSTSLGLSIGEQRNVAFAFITQDVNALSLTIEIVCRPTQSLVTKWQLQTFEKIITGWQKLETDYESKIAALQFQKAAVGPLGAADPETNRETERIELKRSCIAILDYNNQTVRGVAPNIAIHDSPTGIDPVLPEPDIGQAQVLGANVRWFEQAFEWENVAYVLYPYFWGRRSKWIQRLNLKNDDPLFLKFLQAGYARVVVPVRLGFEWAVHFYLHTGLPWLGGGLPPLGDKTQNPLYLDIAEEIKALTGGGEAEETEIPIGDPWEYKLPTTLIKLRKDDSLPEWHRLGLDAKEDESRYPSDQPGGAWLWRDGAPKL